MAVVSVSFDGTRVSAAESATDGGTWDKWGSSQAPSVEPDIVWQFGSANSDLSNKVGTGTAGGVEMDQSTGTHDFTTGHASGVEQVWLAKYWITNYAALNVKGTTGAILYLGTSNADYYHWHSHGSDTYPAAGGWIFELINPNVTGYRDGTTGTPAALSAVDYWGISAQFTATSKSENVVMSAIDFFPQGKGLTLVGGDGASADAVFDDFTAFDEDTNSNRYGIARRIPGGISCLGVLTIGSATATVLTDTNPLVIFEDSKAGAGATGLAFGLQNATNVHTITGGVFKGLGTKAGTTDTRPDHLVTGTTGTLAITGALFEAFRNWTATSAVTLTNCNFVGGELVTQAGATLTGCRFSGATTADGVAHVLSTTPNLISGCDFTFSDGHAIEINTEGVYTFAGNTFTGYGAIGTNDAAIYNTVSATTVDSYSETNQDATQALGNGTITAVGQEFAASAGTLNACRFYLSKTLSPTGTAVAELYATDSGSPAAPTGAVLATSETFDVSTLTGTLTLTQFDFGDVKELSAATSYFIVLRYSGGNATNYVNVGVDTSTPSHGGNFATETASVWTGVSGTDACFYLYRDGGVVLNISGGGSTPTYRNTAAGTSTVVYNTVTLSVTVKDSAGAAVNLAQVAIYQSSDKKQLMNEDTNASGLATADFAYLADTDVYIRVRKSSTGTRYINASTIGTIKSTGLSVTITLRVDPVL